MKLYKIGEFARLANLSLRTIDYYTKLGLIEPEKRSETNYRLYSDETLARIKRIEQLKKEKYSLEEIKLSLDRWSKISRDEELTEKLSSLQQHLMQVEKDIEEIRPIIENMKPAQSKSFFKHITPQSAACIEAILLLLGKNPLI